MSDPERDKNTGSDVSRFVEHAEGLHNQFKAMVEEVGEDRFIQGVAKHLQDPDLSTRDLVKYQALLSIYAHDSGRIADLSSPPS